MIALVSWAFAAPLFTLYVLAFWDILRGDDKAADRRLAWTALLWFVPTVYQIGQESVLYSVLCGGAMLYGVCAFARYWRGYYDEPEVPAEPEQPEAEPPVEVLDSHRGGEAK